ncbi:MAG: FAD-dependent oxidoreductase, partial [Deltaproteobacteria bacterium]|nr:FAD-dependent oxidoreductase [Deltaproteobacteria bacterium]
MAGKIAVIGGGISGLTAAHLLSGEHDVTLFEATDYLGGHTHTVDVPLGGKTWAVDTGFIVFNERTYPNFIRLLDRLGVGSRPSVMSFSVASERSGLEYCSSNLNTLFAQRGNLFRVSFWRMLRDILRFNRASRALCDGGDMSLSLGDYLAQQGYSA